MSWIDYLNRNNLIERICVFILPFLIIFSRALGDIFLVLIGIAFLYYSLKNNYWSWLQRPWILASIFLWVYCCLIVSFFAFDPIHSFLYSLAFIRWPLFCAALSYWLLKDLKQIKTFEFSILIIVIFIISDSLYQYYAGTDIFGYLSPDPLRLTGPFDKLIPGTFTLRIIFIALSALYFLPVFKSEQHNLFFLIICLTISLGFIFLTGERIAFLCMLISSLIVTFFLLRNKKINPFHFILFCLFLISSFLLFVSYNPKMFNRSIVSTITQTQEWGSSPYGQTTFASLAIWKNTNPWTGVGIKNYKTVCNDKNFDSLLGNYPKKECMHPHNFYIEWLVSGGPIALLGFVLIIFFLIREILNIDFIENNHMKIIFSIITLLVSFWPFMSTMSIFSNWIAALLWMTIGWSLAACHPKKSFRT